MRIQIFEAIVFTVFQDIKIPFSKRNINRREIRIEKLRESFSYHFLKYILKTEENNSEEEIWSKISKYIVNDTM